MRDAKRLQHARFSSGRVGSRAWGAGRATGVATRRRVRWNLAPTAQRPAMPASCWMPRSRRRRLFVRSGSSVPHKGTTTFTVRGRRNAGAGGSLRLRVVNLRPVAVYDNAFGTAGRVFKQVPHTLKEAGLTTGLTLLPDGAVVAAFRTGSTTAYLAKFTIDGKLDAGFGSEGIGSIIDVTGEPGGIVRDTAGRFVVGVANANEAFVARFNPNGTPDTTFGENGVARLRDPAAALVRKVALQEDGRIVVVSYDAVARFWF